MRSSTRRGPLRPREDITAQATSESCRGAQSVRLQVGPSTGPGPGGRTAGGGACGWQTWESGCGETGTSASCLCWWQLRPNSSECAFLKGEFQGAQPAPDRRDLKSRICGYVERIQEPEDSDLREREREREFPPCGAGRGEVRRLPGSALGLVLWGRGPGLLRVAPPIPSVTGRLSVLAGPLFCHQRRGDRQTHAGGCQSHEVGTQGCASSQCRSP